MSLDIQLFRGPQREPVERVPLVEVVRKSLEVLIGHPLDGCDVTMALVNIESNDVVTGSPLVYNLDPEFGYIHVSVRRQGHAIYRHPHTIDEIITRMLQQMLRTKYPEETQWAYRVDLPNAGRRKSRPTPDVEGSMPVSPFAPGQKPAFAIRRLPDDPLEEASLADYGIEAGDRAEDQAAAVKVLVPRSLEQELCESRPLSMDFEEGGFLVGMAYRDRETEDAHIVRLTAALAAEHTGASLWQFTFTGDSFAAVKRTLRERRPGERIIGWYHTHLFPATDVMGLSSVDVTLHFSTFSIGWQLAGLINIDGPDRILRFYSRRGGQMVLCPKWVIDECD